MNTSEPPDWVEKAIKKGREENKRKKEKKGTLEESIQITKSYSAPVIHLFQEIQLKTTVPTEIVLGDIESSQIPYTTKNGILELDSVGLSKRIDPVMIFINPGGGGALFSFFYFVPVKLDFDNKHSIRVLITNGKGNVPMYLFDDHGDIKRYYTSIDQLRNALAKHISKIARTLSKWFK